MWVFEDNSFVPCAKIKNGKTYSIITDHLGTPTQMYNDEGESVWERELDIYGKTRRENRKDYVTCEFTYQGQYYDREIDLCYNRFRYYDTELGRYISEDPIGFASGEFNFYNYVDDCNSWVDVFGLTGTYIFTDGNTSYVGKGPKGRMNRSMNQRIAGKDNATNSLHKDYNNDDIGFMVEHKVMEHYDAKNSDKFSNSKKISSPGKRKYNNADEITKKKVDKLAQEFIAEYENKKSKKSYKK